MKLNSDGISLHKPSSKGGGGIIMNDNGEFLFAYVVPLGRGSNNQAEKEVALFGVTWCIHLGTR